LFGVAAMVLTFPYLIHTYGYEGAFHSVAIGLVSWCLLAALETTRTVFLRGRSGRSNPDRLKLLENKWID